MVVVGPPFAGQDRLAAELAAAVQGTLMGLDKDSKSAFVAAYYTGRPIIMHANEAVVAKVRRPPRLVRPSEARGRRSSGR